MAVDTKYSKKQLNAMMERYALARLEPCSFSDLPVKFRLELSQFGKTLSCHLRTTQGIVLERDQLIEWFENLSETEQSSILAA